MALVTGRVLAGLLESSDLCWAMGSPRTFSFCFFFFLSLILGGERGINLLSLHSLVDSYMTRDGTCNRGTSGHSSRACFCALTAEV